MAGRFSARVRGRLFAIQRVDMDLSPGMPHTTWTPTTALILTAEGHERRV
jgi:hypothetical protein